MGCTSVITLHATVSDRFTPLFSAVYVAATGTILGTSYNYIIEFNATTGALIRSVQMPWPMGGPMWLGLIDDLPYLSAHSNPAARDREDSVYHEGVDIFPINTTTLQPSTGLEVYKVNLCSYPAGNLYGPTHFVQYDTDKVVFMVPDYQVVRMAWVRKTGYALGHADLNPATNGGWCEQICASGAYNYSADPYFYCVSQKDTTMNEVGYVTCAHGGTNDYPVACEFGNSKVWAIAADRYLYRCDNFALDVVTVYDLEALLAAAGFAITGIKPLRLRYRSSNSSLYIPCQNKDGIIVFDTNLGTVSWKSGFESPVDVVFTASRVFAVQSSLTGLKEII